MLYRCFNLPLAALQLALFLPLFVCYLFVVRLDSGRSRSNRSELFKNGPSRRRIAGAFSFERALDGYAFHEAYEYLVDSSFVEGRP